MFSFDRRTIVTFASICAMLASVAVPTRTRAASATPSPLPTPAPVTALPAGKPAEGPTNTPPSVAPAPDAPSDPCGGPGLLLATLNRPTIGYSACALPKGAIVLENGYQIQTQSGPSAAVLATFPQGFQRVGLANHLELDLIGPAFNRSRVGGTIATGYSDLGLGFKYELPQKGRFTYALDGLFQAATGTGGFGAGGPTTVANIDLAYAASPVIGIGTTLATGVTSGVTNTATSSRYAYLLPSVIVTAQLPHFYQLYAELAGQTKLAPDQGGHVFSDFGLQKLLGPNLEVDGEYGISFTPVAGSKFRYLGFGLGVRVK